MLKILLILGLFVSLNLSNNLDSLLSNSSVSWKHIVITEKIIAPQLINIPTFKTGVVVQLRHDVNA